MTKGTRTADLAYLNLTLRSWYSVMVLVYWRNETFRTEKMMWQPKNGAGDGVGLTPLFQENIVLLQKSFVRRRAVRISGRCSFSQDWPSVLVRY
mmetsp:Transcript_35523/g.52891  ORF Transcript_35523/g.52891 Transcript_35523/m.52891 type:complete len:94 (-) Transcript_35523:187-468(-)